MTCTVVACAQRSPAWFAARAGLLTASEAAAMLAQPKKGADESVGRTSLRLRLALESLTGVPLDDTPFQSGYMRRGLEREADAVWAYEARTGAIVQPVGFLRHESLPIGCSPDGLVDEEGGVEVKCPKYTTHYDYLQKGKLPSEYVAQVTHSLLVSGLAWWDFVSYCPEFPAPARLFVVRVCRDDVKLHAYQLAVNLFWHEVTEAKRTIAALCAPDEVNREEAE